MNEHKIHLSIPLYIFLASVTNNTNTNFHTTFTNYHAIINYSCLPCHSTRTGIKIEPGMLTYPSIHKLSYSYNNTSFDHANHTLK